MRALGPDLRVKILNTAHDISSVKAGERFGVSGSFVRKLRQRVRQGGTIAADPYPGRTRAIRGADEECLRELIAEQPDATLVELCDRLRERTAVVASEATMSRQLRRMGITRKKKR